MKKYFNLAITLMVVVMSLTFVSCSSDDDEPSNGGSNPSALIGTWQEFYEMDLDASGNEVSDSWYVSGTDCDYVKFKSDGTFVWGWQEDEVYTMSGTYKYDSSKNTITLSLYGSPYARWDISSLDDEYLLVRIYDLQEGMYTYAVMFQKIAKFPWE